MNPSEAVSVGYTAAIGKLKTITRKGLYFRCFSGGVVGARLTINKDGSFTMDELPPAILDWLEADGMHVWNALRDDSIPGPWTPAQTALMWCFPDQAITNKGRNILAHFLNVYMGKELNTELLGLVRSHTSEIVKTAMTVMTDVWGLDIDIKKMRDMDRQEEEDVAYKNANGLCYSLFDTGLAMRCFYKGRTSTHYFSLWPDGEIRCDCQWKKFHWSTKCKHELVRESELRERLTKKEEDDEHFG